MRISTGGFASLAVASNCRVCTGPLSHHVEARGGWPIQYTLCKRCGLLQAR